MQGTRVPTIREVWEGNPGDYTPIEKEGVVVALWFKLPTGSLGRIAATGHGEADENEWSIVIEPDGSVTVDPSIEQHANEKGKPPIAYWHGHLKHGVWEG